MNKQTKKVPPPILVRCVVVNGPGDLSDQTVDEICEIVDEIDLGKVVKEKLAEHGFFNVTVTLA